MQYKNYIHAEGLRVVLPEELYDKIVTLVTEHYPRECGGIFIGRIVDNTAVITGMLMPPTFVSTPILFKRVAAGINTKLEEIFVRDKGETIYLGEWHSHPDGQPVPSDTDIEAMQRIAAAENVRISTPLLMIVGYEKREHDERFYVFYNSQLTRYEKI